MRDLAILFGGETKIKLMRLFLFNPEVIFDLDSIFEKTKISKNLVKKEIEVLKKAKFIIPKNFSKIKIIKKGKIQKEVEVKSKGFGLNQDFSYNQTLRQLLLSEKSIGRGEIIKKLSKLGRLKLIAISGIFIQEENSRLDMLVVGNNMNKKSVEKIVKSIESDLGKELSYAHFETDDFKYRLGMHDRLLRDVFDYPHEILLDKLN